MSLHRITTRGIHQRLIRRLIFQNQSRPFLLLLLYQGNFLISQ